MQTRMLCWDVELPEPAASANDAAPLSLLLVTLSQTCLPPMHDCVDSGRFIRGSFGSKLSLAEAEHSLEPTRPTIKCSEATALPCVGQHLLLRKLEVAA